MVTPISLAMSCSTQKGDQPLPPTPTVDVVVSEVTISGASFPKGSTNSSILEYRIMKGELLTDTSCESAQSEWRKNLSAYDPLT